MNNIHITNYTNNGNCSNCGQCCGDILHLSHSEIHRIDVYLKKHHIEPTPIIRFVGLDLTCPFRDNHNKKCKIYEVRPEICKVFKCDKTPEEAVRNREFTNLNKLPRSMRQTFFNDDYTATRLHYTQVFDRKDKPI